METQRPLVPPGGCLVEGHALHHPITPDHVTSISADGPPGTCRLHARAGFHDPVGSWKLTVDYIYFNSLFYKAHYYKIQPPSEGLTPCPSPASSTLHPEQLCVQCIIVHHV